MTSANGVDKPSVKDAPGQKMRIRNRLNWYLGSLVSLVLITAILATGALIAVEHRASRLANRWVGSEHLLGEMAGQVTEFRLDEAYAAYAADASARVTAERLAEGHAEIVNVELAEYRDSADPAESKMIDAFSESWNTYYLAHIAWISSLSAGTAQPWDFETHLNNLYDSATLVEEQIISDNTETATQDARVIMQVTHLLEAVTTALSALVVTLGAMMLFWTRRDITSPLRVMTDALLRLSKGERDLTVPFIERKDEIGDMAVAFNSFRTTALALEKAHAETRLAQEEASNLARRDPLTGLANRRVLANELDSALARVAEFESAYMVVVIDLDHFKPINDIQGHATGDLVLCEVARRLIAATRRGDVVARLGGDEFAIISRTSKETYHEDARRLSERILDELRKSIKFGEITLEVTASVGIASCPWDGQDSESVLRAADIAMYRAKRENGSGFCLFESSMGEELRAQAALETDLREAILSRTITPHYQPLIDMRTGEIYGFEILSRWHSQARGTVSPEIFIPIAERLGIIGPLTIDILDRACSDCASWPASMQLSLNVSATQLSDTNLVGEILDVLKRHQFDPSRLEIEITETAILGDIEVAKTVFAEFQRHGIRISLDDFGTGYSSLYHLREFKIDKVKIDKSFVLSMQSNVESEKIVSAILGLANSLGIPTVAEGIENSESERFLQAHGCDLGQGYLFARPMDATHTTEFIALCNADALPISNNRQPETEPVLSCT
jgi:diguanylate cyclase (GGDEF)-like protein